MIPFSARQNNMGGMTGAMSPDAGFPKMVKKPACPLWWSVLPSLQNKRILRIAAEGPAADVFQIFQPLVIDCSGYPPDGRTEAGYSSVFHSQGSHSLEHADIILMDDPDCLLAWLELMGHHDFWKWILAKLKPTGSLLLCFPENGFWGYCRRYNILRSLPTASFSSFAWYLADPSSVKPLSIFPVTGGSQLIGRLARVSEDFSLWQLLKKRIIEKIRKTIFALSSIYNPLRSLILVATADIHGETVLDGLVRKSYGALGSDQHTLGGPHALVHVTCKEGQRHLLFVYNGLARSLDMVIKVGVSEETKGQDVLYEYANLQAIERCSVAFDSRGIDIPKPIYRENPGSIAVTAQSGLRGIGVDRIVRGLASGLEEKRAHIFFQELFSFLTRLNTALRSVPLVDCSRVKKEYFENYLNLPISFAEKEEGLVLSYPQHGDLATVNILWNMDASRWGVVDWEWMACRYTAHFDLFSCLTSMNLRCDQQSAKTEAWDESRFESFCDTFFRASPFTVLLRELVARYCDETDSTQHLLRQGLIGYLLIQCNKYRMHYDLPAYLALHEKMLRYAVMHGDSFVLNSMSSHAR